MVLEFERGYYGQGYSLYRSVVLNVILNYRWQCHWVLLNMPLNGQV